MKVWFDSKGIESGKSKQFHSDKRILLLILWNMEAKISNLKVYPFV